MCLTEYESRCLTEDYGYIPKQWTLATGKRDRKGRNIMYITTETRSRGYGDHWKGAKFRGF